MKCLYFLLIASLLLSGCDSADPDPDPDPVLQPRFEARLSGVLQEALSGSVVLQESNPGNGEVQLVELEDGAVVLQGPRRLNIILEDSLTSRVVTFMQFGLERITVGEYPISNENIPGLFRAGYDSLFDEPNLQGARESIIADRGLVTILSITEEAIEGRFTFSGVLERLSAPFREGGVYQRIGRVQVEGTFRAIDQFCGRAIIYRTAPACSTVAVTTKAAMRLTE